MATIKVTCPKCSKPFGVLDRQMGTSVHCPHCRQRMTIGQRKGDAPAGAQGEAAATDGGPASAADALEAAFGPPAKPKPAPKPVMAAPAPQPYQTRLAKNLGVDEDVEQDHLLDNAPVRNRTVVWVWVSILGVMLIGLVIGLVVKYGDYSKAERSGSFKQLKILGEERAMSGPRQQIIHTITDEKGNVIQTVDETAVDLSSKDRIHPDQMLDASTSTLVPHMPPNNVSSYSVTRDNKQYEVWVGYVENTGTEMVRRGTWALRFVDKTNEADVKVFSEQVYWFNDVKPNEKVYFVFEAPYVDASGGKVGIQPIPEVPEDGATNMPVFEFDLKPMSVDRQGRTKGTVSFDVTNLSSVTAPVVDVLFVLNNRDGQPAAYAKTQVMNLVPHRPERAQASYSEAHSLGVDHVGFCRAQVVESGAAQ
ncbi:MAG TPA: hypothetical protein PLP01_02715 [Phycisphaerae bacterium]|nr:hypothetical protein [Phycisphaerae bacterium]HOI54139.1 hypothetical protein [Phycisphaerae bacterium]